jgi:hypothetical protein
MDVNPFFDSRASIENSLCGSEFSAPLLNYGTPEWIKTLYENLVVPDPGIRWSIFQVSEFLQSLDITGATP